jgi:molybdate transport system permease protein
LSTIAVTVVALPVGYGLSRAKFRGRSALDTLLTLPLVLPPTVVGYGIIVVFGSQGWAGAWLREAFGFSIMFRVEGAVLAAAIVSFPLLYLPAKAAFASVDSEFEDIAALMGANRWQVFWHVALPIARRGIVSGQMLAFARALGEFGATVMVFGWRPGRLTMPISIYSAYEQGRIGEALPTVLAMVAICFVLLIMVNKAARQATR